MRRCGKSVYYYKLTMKIFRASKLFGKHSSYKKKAIALINRKLSGKGKMRFQPFSATAKAVSSRGKGTPNPGLVTIQFKNGKVIVRR